MFPKIKSGLRSPHECGCCHRGADFTGVFLFCMPGLLVLLVILFAIIIPVQAASLLLAVRAVFKEDVTFKSAYFLMAIVLIVTSVVMFVVNNMGFPVWIAYATQFVIGALLLGYMIQADDEPIGVLKGSLVSLITTAITWGIWITTGQMLGSVFG